MTSSSKLLDSQKPGKATDKVRIKKWAPKTFNGCLTCKRRRVKCDEARPFCQRCIKSEFPCRGYCPPKVKLYEPNSSIVPKTTIATPKRRPNYSQYQAHLNSCPHPHDFTLLPSFGTKEEYHSFHFFLEKTSEFISLYTQPYLWRVILPQAAWHHPAIKHSIIALATLHQELSSRSPTEIAPGTQTFIRHYNRAIRALVADKPTIDVVLATCIVFWALENFNGCGEAAFDHMKAAVKILKEWEVTRRPDDPSNALIVDSLQPTVRDGIKFASRDRVEELERDMDVLSFSSHDQRIMDFELPNFGSLEDASTVLGDCIRHLLSLQESTVAGIELEEQIKEIDAKLFKWMNLFQTLIPHISYGRTFIVHHVACHILLDKLKARAGMVDETVKSIERPFGFIMHEVEDMIGQKLIETGAFDKLDTAYIGLIPPVFLVAVEAPKVETRWRAISALRQLTLTEGPWSAEVAANIADAMLDVAERYTAPLSHVDLKYFTFIYDPESQLLTIQWEPEDAVFQGVGGSSVLEANIEPAADFPRFIRNFGYQIASSSSC